jgi:hypothetical protein
MNPRTSKPEPEPKDALAQVMRDTQDELIREQVLHRLGAPGDLLNVDIRRLWSDRFRVNVFVGSSYSSARISDSFFLTTNPDGMIIDSSPKIARLYS